MGIPLYVICCFSLAAFSICSLYLIFISLINMCLGVLCLWFVLFGSLWVSWILVAISFPILWKFSTIISSSIFSCHLFLSSSSGTPMIRMLGHLTLSQSSLRLPSFLFVLFSSLLHLFPPFYLPTHLSSPLLKLFSCWFPSECFWSQLLHYSLLIDSSLFLLGSFKVFLASSQSLSLIYLSITSFVFKDLDHPRYHHSEFFFR